MSPQFQLVTDGTRLDFQTLKTLFTSSSPDTAQYGDSDDLTRLLTAATNTRWYTLHTAADQCPYPDTVSFDGVALPGGPRTTTAGWPHIPFVYQNESPQCHLIEPLAVTELDPRYQAYYPALVSV